MESQLIACLQQANISQIDDNYFQQPKIMNSKSSSSQINQNRLRLRMLQNKHQREIIQSQQQNYQNHLREKRRNKENEVMNRLMKTRNQKRSVHPQFLREDRRTLGTQKRDRKQKSVDQLSFQRDLLRLADADQINDKIELRRKKVQFQRIVQMQKIHQKNDLQQQKNRQKLEKMNKITESKSDQYHLKQWHQYEKKLVQKYNKQNLNQNKKNPQKTLELYERFKSKEINFKKSVNYKKTQASKQNNDLQNQNGIIKEDDKQNFIISKSNKNLSSGVKKRVRTLKSQQSLSVEGMFYFGLTRDASLKNKQNLISKLKELILDHRSCADIDKDQNLIAKAEQFLNCTK